MAKRTKTLGAAALLLGACLAGPAGAAMYRCGNVFQDRPCDAGVVEQRITPGGTSRTTAPAAAPAPATVSPFAMACARMGETAQRIVWKREGGATLEKQIGESHGNEDLIATIRAVYARRGTAPEIRAAIESECVAERTKQAEAAEALKALQKQAGPAGAPVPAAPAPAADPAPAATAGPAAAKPNPMCAGWRKDLATIEGQLRAGGNAATMESLQNQRRGVEKQLSDAKC